MFTMQKSGDRISKTHEVFKGRGDRRGTGGGRKNRQKALSLDFMKRSGSF